jgi:hypothetical protein
MKMAIVGESVIVLLVAAQLTGCGSNSPGGWGVRSVDWSQSTADKPTVPGIDHAQVRTGLYANTPVLVVWSDGQQGGFNASWDRTRKAVQYQGTFTSRGGRNVSVHCYTSDGKTGPVAIGDETFELGNGSLFLVASSGPKTVVKQLKRDLSKLGSDSEGLRAIAITDVEIKAFFEQPRPVEP